MQTTDICGETIYICTKEEARVLWADKEKRSAIWLEEESWAFCLAEPAELEEVMAKKKIKPGSYAPPPK